MYRNKKVFDFLKIIDILLIYALIKFIIKGFCMAMQKRLIIVLFALLFALSLIACDKENVTSPEISYEKNWMESNYTKITSNIPTWEKDKSVLTNIPFREDFNGESSIPNGFWRLCIPEVTNQNDPTWNRFFKNTEGYECVRVEDGYLKLTAKKERGPAGLNYKTGGVYSVRNRFGAGTSIKVRAKLYQKNQPNKFYVASAFPAIWYYPLYSAPNWPSAGEIDIMEWVNISKDVSYFTIHYNETNTGKSVYKSKGSVSRINVAEWHVYRCDIYSNNIVIYYDDKEVFRHTNNYNETYPFNDNCYNIILNASLHGTWGTPVERDDSNLPYEMWVDWVEVSLIDKITGKPLNKKLF